MEGISLSLQTILTQKSIPTQFKFSIKPELCLISLISGNQLDRSI